MVTYSFRWDVIWSNLDFLMSGLQMTLFISATSLVFELVGGLVLALFDLSKFVVLRGFSLALGEIIRNTPILVQIFMLFFALPQVGIRLDAFTTAWLSVMLWGGAFNSENFRAGFEAVPERYREAGLALGFGRFATFLNVTLPIGGRISLPSSINTYISVVKNTSLMYVIGYPELTTTAINIANLTLETLEALTVLGIVYLTLVWGLSASIRLLESRLALPEER